MDLSLLYIGLLGSCIGVILLGRDLIVLRSNDIYNGVIVRVKNKVKKSKRYCYPFVDIEDEDASNIGCYSMKKSGHDKYVVGEKIEMLRYKNLLFKTVYKAKHMFLKSSISLIIGGAVLIIASQFV